MNFKVDYVDTLPPPDLKRKTLPSFQELARPWKERHKWPPDAYGTVITVRREKENHTDLYCFEYLQTYSKCFELLSCAYTVKPLISIYGGDFSLLIFEHAINLNSKIGICKLRWRFQMFRMRIRFSQGRYSFVWIDIAIDLSRQRSENLRNLTLRESTA